MLFIFLVKIFYDWVSDVGLVWNVFLWFFVKLVWGYGFVVWWCCINNYIENKIMKRNWYFLNVYLNYLSEEFIKNESI